MTLGPSRVVEQMRGIPLFVGKSSSNCSVCGRPLTAHDSVVRGIGPVCVRKHMGPGPHPSGSPQSVHAGRRTKQKSLSELVRTKPIESRRLTEAESGIETVYVNTYKDGTKVLWKINRNGSEKSEIAAYEFSESIGWGIVPETVLPRGTKYVSAQKWVEGTSAMATAEFRPKSDQMVIMDMLLDNIDRHRNNVLIDKNGKEWAIDNNMAFKATSPSVFNYGPMPRMGTKVTKDRAGLVEAARDVRRWFKTPAYREYVSRLEKSHGKAIARQFSLNVADLIDWSRRAKVIETISEKPAVSSETGWPGLGGPSVWFK